MARLFIAAWPPARVVEHLDRAIPRAPTAALRWVPPGNWHVTLRFLGRAEPGEVAEALADLQAETAEAVVGPVVTTLGRAIVCLPVSGLDLLARAVRDATAGVGEPPERRRFTGHLTLARREGRSPAVGVGHPFTDRFPVSEVALVQSETHPAGARYHVLVRHRLTPRSA